MSASSSSFVRALTPIKASSAAARATKYRRPRAEASRSYSNAAAFAGGETERSLRYRPSSISEHRSSSNISRDTAQSYLSDLLSLPDTHAFAPDVALQILTHKSYRSVHRLGGSDAGPGQESHNARLSFIGRRALAAYTAMFVHSSIESTVALRDHVDFLRGKSLEEKLEALRHVNNLGRAVGEPWRVGSVMRWDPLENAREGGHVKAKGIAVEAIVGGVFTQFGSPAAQRAFHLHVLPHLATQLRDTRLIESAERMRASVLDKFGGVVVVARGEQGI